MQYKALSIAGFDGSGGAGLQADLKTFSALGCYGMTVLTSLPVQNTQGVKKVYDIPISAIREQIETIGEDIEIDAIKIGMIHNANVISCIADQLTKLPLCPVVLDPVMVSKSGHRLLEEEAIQALKERLIRRVTLITPNIPEAEELSGIKILTTAEMEQAAYQLLNLGSPYVLLKGGHLKGTFAQDILVWKDGQRWFKEPRTQTRNTHGTGCTLSAAITACLAQGEPMIQAIEYAKTYLTKAIKAAAYHPVGKGAGPVHHFYHLWPILHKI